MFDFVSFLVISYLCKIDSKCSAVSSSLFGSILLVLVVFFAQKSDFELLLLLARQHFAALFLYLSLNIILSNLHPNKRIHNHYLKNCMWLTHSVIPMSSMRKVIICLSIEPNQIALAPRSRHKETWLWKIVANWLKYKTRGHRCNDCW